MRVLHAHASSVSRAARKRSNSSLETRSSLPMKFLSASPARFTLVTLGTDAGTTQDATRLQVQAQSCVSRSSASKSSGSKRFPRHRQRRRPPRA